MDEIKQKAKAKNTKKANWVGSEKVREMVQQKKKFSGSQNSKSNGLECN